MRKIDGIFKRASIESNLKNGFLELPCYTHVSGTDVMFFFNSSKNLAKKLASLVQNTVFFLNLD
jgi:hypothetical protein